ncbi:MAG: thiosulfate oxidation carrier protein SoxY [Gammaproteobacteria bacterium]|nr:thiosulfate oxidation carrier protein SoxY [Gammaproteobacteria bacterium]
MKRRTLLKSSLAAAVVASTGLLIPGRVMAAYPQAAFASTDEAGALSGLLGSSDYADSPDIKIKAPEIAENGAVVPVQVTSSIAGTESISLVVTGNDSPLAASFNLHDSEPFVSIRIKMGKTADVLAVVKAGGSLHAARQEVKVTIGGCGG